MFPLYRELKSYSHEEPTLSELIEACGDRFRGLTQQKDHLWRAWSDVRILAPCDPTGWCSCGGDHYILAKDQKSPEEAVANLFLALNENQETLKK